MKQSGCFTSTSSIRPGLPLELQPMTDNGTQLAHKALPQPLHTHLLPMSGMDNCLMVKEGGWGLPLPPFSLPSREHLENPRCLYSHVPQ